MKQLLLFCALSLTICTVGAQDAPRIGCKDGILAAQAAETKTALLQQGFEQINDGMLQMSSEEAFPVVVRMKAGQFYQILFIGNTRAKKIALELSEKSQGSLVYKQQHPLNQQSNAINFSFTPAVDGDYLFTLEQKMKSPGILKRAPEACGSFTIFRLKASVERPANK